MISDSTSHEDYSKVRVEGHFVTSRQEPRRYLSCYIETRNAAVSMIIPFMLLNRKESSGAEHPVFKNLTRRHLG